jgi:hypothetical protein
MASAEGLERLKSLKGRWKGDFLHGEEKGVAEVEYRLTGGGTAVQETLFPGEPHEMVTLYHLDGSRLLLTHYCAAGNQPTMVLAPGGAPGMLHFDFLRATNLKTPGDGHMHEASFDLSDPARLRTTWTFWADGKAQGTAAMDLRRVE